MAISTPFQTLFAVPMTCESCIKDVQGSLLKLSGIQKVDANLKDQLVTVEGTAPPSAIAAAIQATGRDAILRGSGTSNGAAVCILETHSTEVSDKVRGLARLVQVAPNLTLVDLVVRGLEPGSYWATIRQAGDISQGAISTGSVWTDGSKTPGVKPRGVLGTVQVGKDRFGSAFLESPIQIWEMIGRGMVFSKQHDGQREFQENDENTLVGVIARSAGVWDNDKTVCSCSGKTLWEERKDEVKKGMI
ncbi:hypothetical protein B7463_g9434, partial [Scytalidium lignicola]